MQNRDPFTSFKLRIGSYRTTYRVTLVNTQAADSRLLEIRNADLVNGLLLTRLWLRWIQAGNHTAQIIQDIRVYHATGFSADATTDATTLTCARMDTRMPATTAVAKGVTTTGVAAGMTGGTLTPTYRKGMVPLQMQAAVSTAAQQNEREAEIIRPGDRPIYFAPGEGLSIQNGVLMGAAASSVIYFDAQFDEVVPYP